MDRLACHRDVRHLMLVSSIALLFSFGCGSSENDSSSSAASVAPPCRNLGPGSPLPFEVAGCRGNNRVSFGLFVYDHLDTQANEVDHNSQAENPEMPYGYDGLGIGVRVPRTELIRQPGEARGKIALRDAYLQTIRTFSFVEVAGTGESAGSSTGDTSYEDGNFDDGDSYWLADDYSGWTLRKQADDVFVLSRLEKGGTQFTFADRQRGQDQEGNAIDIFRMKRAQAKSDSDTVLFRTLYNYDARGRVIRVEKREGGVEQKDGSLADSHLTGLTTVGYPSEDNPSPHEYWVNSRDGDTLAGKGFTTRFLREGQWLKAIEQRIPQTGPKAKSAGDTIITTQACYQFGRLAKFVANGTCSSTLVDVGKAISVTQYLYSQNGLAEIATTDRSGNVSSQQITYSGVPSGPVQIDVKHSSYRAAYLATHGTPPDPDGSEGGIDFIVDHERRLARVHEAGTGNASSFGYDDAFPVTRYLGSPFSSDEDKRTVIHPLVRSQQDWNETVTFARHGADSALVGTRPSGPINRDTEHELRTLGLVEITQSNIRPDVATVYAYDKTQRIRLVEDIKDNAVLRQSWRYYNNYGWLRGERVRHNGGGSTRTRTIFNGETGQPMGAKEWIGSRLINVPRDVPSISNNGDINSVELTNGRTLTLGYTAAGRILASGLWAGSTGEQIVQARYDGDTGFPYETVVTTGRGTDVTKHAYTAGIKTAAITTGFDAAAWSSVWAPDGDVFSPKGTIACAGTECHYAADDPNDDPYAAPRTCPLPSDGTTLPADFPSVAQLRLICSDELADSEHTHLCHLLEPICEQTDDEPSLAELHAGEGEKPTTELRKFKANACTVDETVKPYLQTPIGFQFRKWLFPHVGVAYSSRYVTEDLVRDRPENTEIGGCNVDIEYHNDANDVPLHARGDDVTHRVRKVTPGWFFFQADRIEEVRTPAELEREARGETLPLPTELRRVTPFGDIHRYVQMGDYWEHADLHGGDTIAARHGDEGELVYVRQVKAANETYLYERRDGDDDKVFNEFCWATSWLNVRYGEYGEHNLGDLTKKFYVKQLVVQRQGAPLPASVTRFSLDQYSPGKLSRVETGPPLGKLSTHLYEIDPARKVTTDISVFSVHQTGPGGQTLGRASATGNGVELPNGVDYKFRYDQLGRINAFTDSAYRNMGDGSAFAQRWYLVGYYGSSGALKEILENDAELTNKRIFHIEHQVVGNSYQATIRTPFRGFRRDRDDLPPNAFLDRRIDEHMHTDVYRYNNKCQLVEMRSSDGRSVNRNYRTNPDRIHQISETGTGGGRLTMSIGWHDSGALKGLPAWVTHPEVTGRLNLSWDSGRRRLRGMSDSVASTLATYGLDSVTMTASAGGDTLSVVSSLDPQTGTALGATVNSVELPMHRSVERNGNSSTFDSLTGSRSETVLDGNGGVTATATTPFSTFTMQSALPSIANKQHLSVPAQFSLTENGQTRFAQAIKYDGDGRVTQTQTRLGATNAAQSTAVYDRGHYSTGNGSVRQCDGENTCTSSRFQGPPPNACNINHILATLADRHEAGPCELYANPATRHNVPADWQLFCKARAETQPDTCRGQLPDTSHCIGYGAGGGGAVQQARQSARRTRSHNNLKHIGLAMLNHESATGELPAAYLYDVQSTGEDRGKPLFSWRVWTLQYMEENAIFEHIRSLSGQWKEWCYGTTSEEMEDCELGTNPWYPGTAEDRKGAMLAVNTTLPAAFDSPFLPDDAREKGMTNVVAAQGRGAVFEPVPEDFDWEDTWSNDHREGAIRLGQITDGTSKTIAAIELEPHEENLVNWLAPSDGEFDINNAERFAKVNCTFPALFVDGSVRTLAGDINKGVLRRLMCRADGNPVDLANPHDTGLLYYSTCEQRCVQDARSEHWIELLDDWSPGEFDSVCHCGPRDSLGCQRKCCEIDNLPGGQLLHGSCVCNNPDAT